MIVLDTHIWIWWVDETPKLSSANLEIVQTHQGSGLGISIISCWEIAKLVEKGRLSFDPVPLPFVDRESVQRPNGGI